MDRKTRLIKDFWEMFDDECIDVVSGCLTTGYPKLHAMRDKITSLMTAAFGRLISLCLSQSWYS